MLQRPGHSHLVVSQNVTWYNLGEQFRIGDHSLSQSNVCILLLVCFVGISAGEVSRKQHRDVRAGSSTAPSVIAALPTRVSSLLTCTSDWWDEHRQHQSAQGYRRDPQLASRATSDMSRECLQQSKQQQNAGPGSLDSQGIHLALKAFSTPLEPAPVTVWLYRHRSFQVVPHRARDTAHQNIIHPIQLQSTSRGGSSFVKKWTRHADFCLVARGIVRVNQK